MKEKSIKRKTTPKILKNKSKRKIRKAPKQFLKKIKKDSRPKNNYKIVEKNSFQINFSP